MRILDTTTFELVSGDQESFKRDGYAILSHRWMGQEITFEQLPNHTADLKHASPKVRLSPQLAKIRGACDLARSQGIRWMWIDTCCINKASTVEETESINSMFRWYRDAQVCITYLFDVDITSSSNQPPYNNATTTFQHDNEKNNIAPPSIFRKYTNPTQMSEWCSRGWTLQELLAPRHMQFYDTHWRYMGSKTELASDLERITGIEVAYLTGAKHFRKACIATKMSWQAGRTTTREEDIAYSMLGLFNIIMTPQYGEGSRAFMRLQNALLATTMDESLFAWRMPSPASGEKYDVENNAEVQWRQDEWGMLAPTPDWFRDCGRVTIEGGAKIERSGKGFQMTRQGLEMSVPPITGYGKYTSFIPFLVFLVCLAPVGLAIIAKKVQKKVAEEGLPFVLNCWVVNDAGQLAAVQVYMRPLVFKTFTQGNEVAIYKRIRCSELACTVDYVTRGTSSSEVFVVQPELSYGD